MFSYISLLWSILQQMLPFYTSWKHRKIKGFLLFSGGIKWNIFCWILETVEINGCIWANKPGLQLLAKMMQLSIAVLNSWVVSSKGESWKEDIAADLSTLSNKNTFLRILVCLCFCNVFSVIVYFLLLLWNFNFLVVITLILCAPLLLIWPLNFNR